MNISDLVQFLNYLDEYDLATAYTQSLDPVNNIAKMVLNSDVLDRAAKDPVKHSINGVDESLQNFLKSVRELRQKIMWQIQQLEPEYFAASNELFNIGYRNDSVDHIINRTMSLSDEAAALFEQRLKLYTSWQHAGLIFRPVHLTAFHEIVALDPMYLVDTHEELLTLRTQQFNERYQRRVRNYIIDDYAEGSLLDQLPRNQFGLVAAQNFFNFKPIEIVIQIITEVYSLLKPGGAFVFTYNNCDFAGAVKLAERSFTCYTPGRLIKQAAAAVGFQLNFEHNEINGVSILELGRHGHQESIRGGQTLAVIKDSVHIVEEPVSKKTKRSKTPKTIDTVSTRYYTEQERFQLEMSAVALGIDTEDRICNDYTMENLEQFVTDRLNTRDFNQAKFQKRLDKLIQKRKNT
jgi:SAM-dependent methyltransferase